MLVMGIDTETNSPDPNVAELTELAWVVYDTERETPLLTGGGYALPIDPVKFELPQKATAITGITLDDLDRFGRDSRNLIGGMIGATERYGIEWACAHNMPYDRTVLRRIVDYWWRGNDPMAVSFGAISWIDTWRDLPDAPGGSGKLAHHLADIGVIMPFKHRALFDALGSLRLLQHYGVERAIESALTPRIVVQALVPYDEKQDAKDRWYRWEDPFKDKSKLYPKRWVKVMRETEYAREFEEAPFPLEVIDEIPATAREATWAKSKQ